MGSSAIVLYWVLAGRHRRYSFFDESHPADALEPASNFEAFGLGMPQS